MAIKNKIEIKLKLKQQYADSIKSATCKLLRVAGAARYALAQFG